MKGKELQNEEFILKGNLGTVNGEPITEMFRGKDGFTTLTITPFPTSIEINDRRECVFNVDAIDERLIELGALEDITHEEIKPNTK